MPTSIVVWVLVVAAFAAFLPMRGLVYWPADVAPLWVLATLGLAFPLAPRARIAVGASVVGAMVTIVLFVLSPDSLTGRVPIVAGSLVIAAVAVIHLRPVYASLRINRQRRRILTARQAKRSVAATSAASIPGSECAWPASGITWKSACGQA